MCRPDGRHVLNNQGTDDYVLTVFAHIHVSYIINLGHIRAIDGDEVVMDNEERLLIARSHKQNLKEKHMEFVRRMV